MRTLSLCFSLLLVLSAHGQPSPINRRALAIAGLASSTTPATLGANYWWVYTDMASGINVTNWIDRIQASVWTNGFVDATRPTTDANGVLFNRANSTVLTNSGVSFANTSTHFVIVKRTSASAFQDILDQANSGLLEWFWNNASQWLFSVSSANRLVDGNTSGTTAFFDMVMVTDGNGNVSDLYTNGVSAKHDAVAIPAGIWKIMGGIPNNGFFGGYFKEMAVWTNVNLNTTKIGQLHTYATNTYGYTP